MQIEVNYTLRCISISTDEDLQGEENADSGSSEGQNSVDLFDCLHTANKEGEDEGRSGVALVLDEGITISGEK